MGASGFDVDVDGTDRSIGAAFVYQYNGSSWIPLGDQIDYVNLNGISYNEGSFFGFSVSLSSDGTILGSGAFGFDRNNVGNVGAVFAYSLSQTSLHAENKLKITGTNGEHFFDTGTTFTQTTHSSAITSTTTITLSANPSQSLKVGMGVSGTGVPAGSIYNIYNYTGYSICYQ